MRCSKRSEMPFIRPSRGVVASFACNASVATLIRDTRAAGAPRAARRTTRPVALSGPLRLPVPISAHGLTDPRRCRTTLTRPFQIERKTAGGAGQSVRHPPFNSTGRNPRKAESFEGTSKNCHRSSAAANLLANDSGLFPFRFCAVHPKDAGDCKPQEFFEVPLSHLMRNRLSKCVHVENSADLHKSSDL
jgi:hypothetical protein